VDGGKSTRSSSDGAARLARREVEGGVDYWL